MGRDFELLKGVLDRHGIGYCSDNGRLLLEFCPEHQFVITNNLFLQKDRFKEMWRHQRSRHWGLLNYALTRQRDTRDLLYTRVLPSADCCIDYRQVRCKVAFTFKLPPKRKCSTMKKLQVYRLRDPRVKNNLQVL